MPIKWNSPILKEVSHFVLKCEEFAMDRCQLLESVGEIVGAEKWL